MSTRIDEIDKSIVMEGIENGIADSPFLGISDMRNVNIVSVPGEGSVNFSTAKISLPPKTGTVTAGDAGANTISITGASLMEFWDIYGSGMAVTFAGDSLPAGITAGTPYFMGYISTGPVKVELYIDNAMTTLVDITGNGTGTWTSIDMGIPKHFATNNTGTQNYLIDSNGRVWWDVKKTGGDVFGNYQCWTYALNTTLTNANGNGLAYYLASAGTSTNDVPYLFVFRNDKIDYCNLNTLVWTYGWKTLKTVGGVSNSHETFNAPDNVIYFCDSYYIGRFFQSERGTIFDPTSAPSYTFDETALLPSHDKAQCLSFLGTNLLIGGQKNIIYPWDTTSPTYTYPIMLSESNIVKMVTVNTNTFIFLGNRGRIYVTNGTNAQLYKKIPDHISGTIEPYFTWGGACSIKNQLYFSANVTTNSGTALSMYGGVWAVDLDTKSIRLTNKLSYATYAGYSTALMPIVTSSNPAGTGLYIGWNDGSSGYGLDKTIGTPYTGSQAVIDFDLIPIGTFENPKNFTRVEYRLTKPLVSGESITINYRLDFSQTYTFLFADSTVGRFSYSSPINFKNAQWIQLQVVLNSIARTPSYTRLKEIRIKI